MEMWENRHLPPVYLPFLAELDISESFETILFFFKKNPLGYVLHGIFCLNSNIFEILPIVKSVQKINWFLIKKCLNNSVKNGKTVSATDGGSAAVSSVFCTDTFNSKNLPTKII